MVIDLIFAGVLMYGLYIGYSNGIIKTVFTVVSILAGFLVTAHFHETVTQVLKDITQYDNPLMMFGGMAVTFLLTMVFLRMLGRQIEGLFKFANINFINKILGGVVMSFLFAAIYSMIITFMSDARLLKNYKEDSKTYPYLELVQEQSAAAYAQVSPKVKEMWQNMTDALDQINESTEKNVIEDFDGKERKTRTIGGEEGTNN